MPFYLGTRRRVNKYVTRLVSTAVLVDDNFSSVDDAMYTLV